MPGPRDGRLCAFRARFFPLDFVQESVVFLNNSALKSTLAPAQGITGIPTYRGTEMSVPVLFDEFNHIFDYHGNLLIDVDAAATIESSPILLQVIIEEEFVGRGAKANRSQFALSLVADPSLNQIFGEHIALQQKLVIFLQSV